MNMLRTLGFVALAAASALGLGSVAEAEDFVARDHFVIMQPEQPALVMEKIDTIGVGSKKLFLTPISYYDPSFEQLFLDKKEGSVTTAEVGIYRLSRDADPEEVFSYFEPPCELTLGQFYSLLGQLYKDKDNADVPFSLALGIVAIVRDKYDRPQILSADLGLKYDSWRIFTGYTHSGSTTHWPQAVVACP